MDSFVIIGGDLRFKYLYNMLLQRGYTVYTYGLFDNESEQPEGYIENASAVILPVPLSKDGKTLNAPYCEKNVSLDYLMKIIKGKKILAGAINKSALFIAENNGVEIIDYAKDEAFSLYNAVLTAEGALSMAIEKSPFSVFESKCLVLGYGRIGKYIAKYFSSLGANVCVAARKSSDIALIKTSFYSSENIYNISNAGKYDFIINTVPHMIIDEKIISRLNKSCIIIDLASTPGGTDFAYAESYGIQAYHALSLPSKYSPKSAAKIIMESVLYYIHGQNS